MKPSRLNYCHYLLVSQINYTLTNFADHTQAMSHDAINRYLRSAHISARAVWNHVRDDLVLSPHGYVVFDDTVVDKNRTYALTKKFSL